MFHLIVHVYIYACSSLMQVTFSVARSRCYKKASLGGGGGMDVFQGLSADRSSYLYVTADDGQLHCDPKQQARHKRILIFAYLSQVLPSSHA